MEAIDGGLREVFERADIDIDRVAVGGFSDGSSYALSLGLTNGDLFGHVIAFSPKLMRPGALHGRPASSSRTARTTACSPSTVAAAASPALEGAGDDVQVLRVRGRTPRTA